MTQDHEALPQRPWWKRPATAATAAIVIAVVIISAIAFGGESTPDATDVSDEPTPTISAPPTATNLATPSDKAPTPTATAPSEGSAPKSVKAPLDGSATPATSVTVSVPKIDKVTGKAEGIGEIAGPALRFTLRVDNQTARAIRLGNVVVNAYYGAEKTPASSLSGPGAKTFGPSVAPGTTADGTYVFSIPNSGRGDVTVEFSYSTEASTVVFSGSAR